MYDLHMKCAEHPRYVATRHPLKTVKHPDGCPRCWGIWEAAKNDPKKLLPTVNLELTLEEARVFVLTLDRLTSRLDPETAQLIQPYRMIVLKALKEAM